MLTEFAAAQTAWTKLLAPAVVVKLSKNARAWFGPGPVPLLSTCISLISIPAGMDRMPLPRFLLFTVLGTLIWSAILSYAGWVLKENYELVAGYVERYQNLVVVLILLAVLAFVYLRIVKPRIKRTA